MKLVGDVGQLDSESRFSVILTNEVQELGYSTWPWTLDKPTDTVTYNQVNIQPSDQSSIWTVYESVIVGNQLD